MASIIAASERSSGSFKRQEDAFRQWVRKDGSTPFVPSPGRYHLYVSLACPWAHRTLIVRRLKRLEETVSASVVDPVRTEEEGWAFREGPGYSRDPINGFAFLKEAYFASDPHFKGRWTVPVLWDKETRRIVNNSEDDICRMFNDEFPTASDTPNLFPPELRSEQEQLSEHIYSTVNNGVYAAGFATRQTVYEKAAQTVFDSLDALNDHLATRRYLLGGNAVETDWRLFCTLVRFDPVYHGHFKCNLRRIVDYAHLQRYLKTLYALPGIAETVNFDHIKRHYYMTHEDINPTRIVPIGPALDLGAHV
ncbi:MAG TPA: glutathione S-transferase C-terminal domain-containing protein [Opitutaceae bacterium]|nr:glutathione S-transferase C-terminal domain-containing protein [Opitutaceae bacterium]